MVDADMKAAGLDPIGEGDEILSIKFPNRWWNAIDLCLMKYLPNHMHNKKGSNQ